MVGVGNRHIDGEPMNVSWLFQEKQWQWMFGLVYHNNSEGGRIPLFFRSWVFFVCLLIYFFKMTVFQSDYVTAQLVATCEANGGMKCVLEKQASQQCAKKRKRYTNFPDTDRAEIDRYTAIIVTAHVLEGGAKIGTAHSQKYDCKLLKLA